MSTRKPSRQVVWRNVTALMRHAWGKEDLTQLAREAHLGPATMQHLKGGKTPVGLDSIDKIAAVFDLEPWQLLLPDLDPVFPQVARHQPVVVAAMEQALRATLKAHPEFASQTARKRPRR